MMRPRSTSSTADAATCPGNVADAPAVAYSSQILSIPALYGLTLR